MSREFATAWDFRQSLTVRLRALAAGGQGDLRRMRRQVAFERLLARLQHSPASPWILKGGHALEIRFEQARSTVDLDLMAPISAFPDDSELAPQIIRAKLIHELDRNLGDFFEFDLASDGKELSGPKYAGYRFSVRAMVNDKPFERFHLDIGIGDPLIGGATVIKGTNWLDFAGIAAPDVRAISGEQQFAEKVHAYTLPRERVNTRIKDLLDLYLLTSSGSLDRAAARQALRIIFSRRGTHPLPMNLVPPPDNWESGFSPMARQCSIMLDLTQAYEAVERFYRSILGTTGS